MIFGKDKLKMSRLEADNASLKYDLSQLKKELDLIRKKEKEFDELRYKYNELTKKLRDQNEADIVYSSLKLIKESLGRNDATIINELKQRQFNALEAQRNMSFNQQAGLGFNLPGLSPWAFR